MTDKLTIKKLFHMILDKKKVIKGEKITFSDRLFIRTSVIIINYLISNGFIYDYKAALGRISNSSKVKLIDWNSSKMKILKKNSSKTSPNLASGGGLVVSLLAFYSVDLSSNPAGYLSCMKRLIKWKSARGWPIFLKTHRLTNPKGGGSSVAECS